MHYIRSVLVTVYLIHSMSFLDNALSENSEKERNGHLSAYANVIFVPKFGNPSFLITNKNGLLYCLSIMQNHNSASVISIFLVKSTFSRL